MRMFGIDLETAFPARTREGKTTAIIAAAATRPRESGIFMMPPWPPPEKRLTGPCACPDPVVFGCGCGRG
jgi:hypothetical protein